MTTRQLHYELYVRRRPSSPWTLDGASEDRERLIQEAHALVAERQAAAVRIVREAYDANTHEFTSVVVLTLGDVSPDKLAPKRDTHVAPVCVSPTDLYTLPAREQIAVLLKPWLRHRNVTAFELLHRPDLAEALDRSGLELQGALQKMAIVQGGPGSLHDHLRSLQTLVEATIARVIRDGRRRAFPSFTDAGGEVAFAAAGARLHDHPEGAYLLGGGVAARMALANSWGDKVSALVGLAERAPPSGPAREFALGVLEQPLVEILGSHAGLAELAGGQAGAGDIEIGHELAMLTRLAAGAEVRALAERDVSVASTLPALTGPAAQLAAVMEAEAFGGARGAAARRVLRELNGPRRLLPSDPSAEIALLRALAMALTVAAGRLFPIEDVQAAFLERSKRLVSADFVESYLAGRDDPVAEAHALVRLAENVAGPVNKTAATRWLTASIGSLRFEKSVRSSSENPFARLTALAELQHSLAAARLSPADATALAARLGDLGGAIEAEARLVEHLARSETPAVTRLLLLLKMAAGQGAPLGAAADRARIEAMKLMREPEVRTDLARRPDARARVMAFMDAAAAA